MKGILQKGLTANALKIIAIIAMTLDHLAWVIFPGFPTDWWILLIHSVGRLTAPIMCFFIAEGFHYTRNVKKYAFRLFLFAVISHFAYNFAFAIPLLPFSEGSVLDQTGVIWALFLGLVSLIITYAPKEKLSDAAKYFLIALCCIAAVPANWSCIAVLVVLNFGINRSNFKKQMIGMMVCVSVYALVYCLTENVPYGLIQLMAVLAIPVLKLYNGQKGTLKGMKWFFYIYYPLHLVICGIIRILL